MEDGSGSYQKKPEQYVCVSLFLLLFPPSSTPARIFVMPFCRAAKRERWNPHSRLGALGDITRHERGFDLRCGHGSSTRRKRRRRRERLSVYMWREWGRRGEMERGDKGCDKKSVHLVSLFERG